VAVAAAPPAHGLHRHRLLEMLTASLGASRPQRVLCIGCHADDVEIGCGATLLALAERDPALEVTWLVLSAAGKRGEEARASAAAFCSGLSRPARLFTEEFRDGFFPYLGGAVKDRFERLKEETDPLIIFTHSGDDLHQDHRLVAELTWNTFRDHLILEYEIPKYDGDLGSPNLFVPVREELARKKVELLLEHYPSQRAKHWFTEDLFYALMRLRGMESNSPTRLAEAFRCRKLALAP
jgi:LmbE family N-acetylglucosaminyl deacetylase